MKKKKRRDITIGDLLKMESEYQKNHRIPVFGKKYSSFDYWYSMAFADGHILIQYRRNLTTDLKQKLSTWKLTRFEMLMLLCYMGNLSEDLNKGDSTTSPYPINEMCKAMDAVLIKAPVCTGFSVLYRQCRHDPVDNWEKGSIVTIPCYLTTSINNWNQPNNQLIITPKEQDTNAKALYKMHNNNGEFQVTFKRGTIFLIEKIEPFEMDGCNYKKFWIKEL